MQSGENILIENEKKVSIIMPVYNSEKYVSEAIESVCHQNYKNWELLIVNDGSTDLSAEIIERYAKKDSRITVFHKRNEGVSNARNFALGKISGDYVTFIDSDDVYHMDRLEKMVQVFEKHRNCDVVFSRHNEFTGKLAKVEQIGSGKTTLYNEDIVLKVISDSQNHFICNIMLKSSIAKKEQFASIRFAEDFCYIRDCAWYCRKMAVLDEVLYYYRRDNENAMTSHFFTEKYITVMDALGKCKKIAYISSRLYHYRYVEGSTSHRWNKNIIVCRAVMWNHQRNFLESLYGGMNQLVYAEAAYDNYIWAIYHLCSNLCPLSYKEKRKELLSLEKHMRFNEYRKIYPYQIYVSKISFRKNIVVVWTGVFKDSQRGIN